MIIKFFTLVDFIYTIKIYNEPINGQIGHCGLK